MRETLLREIEGDNPQGRTKKENKMLYTAFYTVQLDARLDGQVRFAAINNEEAIQIAQTEIMEKFRKELKKNRPQLTGKKIILRRVVHKGESGPFSEGTKIFP